MNKKLEVHFLNSTARDIVELIGNRTIQEICESMMEIYEVEENVIRRDVINTIRNLQWKHLIRISR
ncbi:MAG: PqqD family protein [Thermoguttaceae bacterium]|nr:PqqD family protein [Thermoguttaceae bacterium]